MIIQKGTAHSATNAPSNNKPLAKSTSSSEAVNKAKLSHLVRAAHCAAFKLKLVYGRDLDERVPDSESWREGEDLWYALAPFKEMLPECEREFYDKLGEKKAPLA